MFVSWVALRIQDRTRPAAPPFFLPLVAYGVLTLVSSVFSVDPARASSTASNSCFWPSCRRSTTSRAGRGPPRWPTSSSPSGAASALVGILQYGVLHYDNLGQRPQGTLTHYMTYSGVVDAGH